MAGEVVSSQAPGETLVLVEAARELITPRAHLGPSTLTLPVSSYP